MEFKGVLLVIFFLGAIYTSVFTVEEGSTSFRSSHFITLENKQLIGDVVKRFVSPSLLSCNQQCMRNSWCTSTNYKVSNEQENKGTCELNKGEFSFTNKNIVFQEQEGATFSMRLEGCLMTGCLNDGSCLFDNQNQTFSCSCKPPWTGDRCEVKLGETSLRSNVSGPECSSYLIDSQEDRSVSFPKAIRKCDDALVPGWYRFNSTAGLTIPTYCVPSNMCNADGTGWLNGTHPTLLEGVVNRTVCFNWAGNCCNWRVTISVRNCGLFYVYRLVRTPLCYLRYCVTN
ncbi:uncharacterized protein LOC144666259 isoform X1 [Oculina patagonica]